MSRDINRTITTIHWPDMLGRSVVRVNVGLSMIGIRFADDTFWACEVSEGMLYHSTEQKVSLKEFIQNDHGVRSAIAVGLLDLEEDQRLRAELRQEAKNSIEAQDRAKFLALKAKYGW